MSLPLSPSPLSPFPSPAIAPVPAGIRHMTMRTPTLRSPHFNSGPSDYEAEALPTVPGGLLEAYTSDGRAEDGKSPGSRNTE